MKTIITLGSILVAGCGVTEPVPGGTDDTARTGVVTVHAYEEGVGASGRIAVFQDADGAPLSTRETGSDGLASFPITAGDMVTVANVGAEIFDLTTYVDVEPDDELTIGEAAREDGVGDIGPVPVSLSSPAPEGTRGEVSLGLAYVEHDGGAPTLHLTDEDIDAEGSFQVLGVARDLAGLPVAFSVARADALTADGGVTLPEWRTDWDAIHVAIDHLPATATVELEAALIQGADGRFDGWSAEPEDGSSFDVQVPPGLGDELVVDLDVVDGDGVRVLVERGPARSSIALDAEADLLPVVSGVAIEPGDDPARPTVTWLVAGDAPAADLLLIRVTWGAEHRWNVILPADHAPSFQLPELPELLDAWAPDGTLEVAVGLIDLSTLDGYRAAVRRGAEELEELEDAGSFRLSAWGDLGI